MDAGREDISRFSQKGPTNADLVKLRITDKKPTIDSNEQNTVIQVLFAPLRRAYPREDMSKLDCAQLIRTANNPCDEERQATWYQALNTSKNAVLSNFPPMNSRRSYEHAVRDFIDIGRRQRMRNAVQERIGLNRLTRFGVAPRRQICDVTIG